MAKLSKDKVLISKDEQGRDKVYLFDTTLRDGAQTHGIDFSLSDKIRIAKLLDELGIDYIEGGFPGANPADSEFFATDHNFKNSTFTAFGMTKRAGRSAANDPGLAAIVGCKATAACIVAKSWDFHVDVALNISNEENLGLISDTVSYLVDKNFEAMIDCEHFFDGFKANPDYALACAKAAYDNGARWIVLCDTNGGTLPMEIKNIVTEVIKEIPGTHLSIHAHNDTGNAIANSLMAIEAGVRQVQGAINGLGERCGNTNLITLIANLSLKPFLSERFYTNINDENLKTLRHVSQMFDAILNRASTPNAPYVGDSAFASKAGIHVSAIMKNPKTYEHIEPTLVGNKRNIMVSEQAGKSNIIAELDRIGLAYNKDDSRIDRLLAKVKEREAMGYAYETAAASFELLARRELSSIPNYFDVDSFRILVERRHNALGELITISEATVKMTVAGEKIMSVGEGNGPVNALDAAMRKDLGKYSERIADLKLIDFKVRILNSGTEAITRVMIESGDATGKKWFTVGVSPNIVDASFQALTDSIIYKLILSEV